MGDKETLGERVNDLLVNPDVIERVVVYHNDGKEVANIPNADGKRMSLQIYAAITNNESMITTEGAQKGLNIFGEELVSDARANPGKHPSIDLLDYHINLGHLAGPMHSHVVTPYSAKPIPEQVRAAMPKIAREFGTPVHVYDEEGIRQTCRDFNSAFSWNKGYKNFFAVKACPNPFLMEIMQKEGFGDDCSSALELTLAYAAGMTGEDKMFTSNDTADSEFNYARELRAIINLDDITHIEALERAAGGLSKLLCFRYNPGNKCEGNTIIGNPVEAKYGLTHEQIFEAYKIAKEKGVKRFGLHTMMASNERNPDTLERQAKIMFKLAREIKEQVGIDFEFINLGGGIGTPYKPWDRGVDLDDLGNRIQKAYNDILGSPTTKIFTECGRAPIGPHGWLLTGVRHVMKKHRDYVGVDATMADLMRPGMYGAYHHATVLGKEEAEHNRIVDVVGSLCENCDKFAVQRFLPSGIQRGDLIAIHNAGAHGRAMCFNYNAKLRSGEVLVHPDGTLEMIRRPETERDYFATFDFPGSRYSKLVEGRNPLE
jgi:diaminopimelate decarboxylase